jgi:hypothetical protein
MVQRHKKMSTTSRLQKREGEKRGGQEVESKLTPSLIRSSVTMSSEGTVATLTMATNGDIPALPIQPGGGAADEMQRIKEATGALPENTTAAPASQ